MAQVAGPPHIPHERSTEWRISGQHAMDTRRVHGSGRVSDGAVGSFGHCGGVCQEIGLAAYLDAFDEQQHERASVGTAVVAMILNGLGFSNRRLYLEAVEWVNASRR